MTEISLIVTLNNQFNSQQQRSAYPPGNLVPSILGFAYAPIVDTSLCLFSTLTLNIPRYFLDLGLYYFLLLWI